MAKFTFVVSCYNYADYLPQCLDSIVGQEDADDWELICVDDGSTDTTLEILRKFANRESRMRVITQKNAGLEAACNAGILAARSPLIIRVDADDFIKKNYLKVMDRAMTEHPDYSFYYVREYTEYFDDEERNEKLLPEFDVEEIFERGDFFATGTIYTKAHLMEMGLYSTGIPNCGLENYAMILSLISAGYAGCPVAGTGFTYRRHGKNMSTVKRKKIIEYGRNLLAKYGREFKTNKYHPYNLVL